jgi:plastocyanin
VRRAFVAALGLLLCSGPGAAAPKPVTHTVTMDAVAYKPDVVDVKVGDSVVWVNKDFIPHTATSTEKGFDSGQILQDKSWTFTAKAKGDFPYVCTFHPTMKGTLRVR